MLTVFATNEERLNITDALAFQDPDDGGWFPASPAQRVGSEHNVQIELKGDADNILRTNRWGAGKWLLYG